MPYGIVQADQLQTSVTGGTLGPGNATNFKNRILNGGMAIDQRNSGAQITPVSGDYIIDRWYWQQSVTGKFTFQQNAGSVTPPAGFTNYAGFTVASAYSITSGDYFIYQQKIEGLNVADLAWGTADAKTITLSFWVRSSLTGTFGGAVCNSTANRDYVFSYTINSANTWEQKSITIAGDTSGTWLKTNSTGLWLRISLGAGSSYTTTTPGSWVATGYLAPTDQVNVAGTNGATWYITGVQIEVGSNATGFEVRDYGRELMLCQRYFYLLRSNASQTNSYVGPAIAYSGSAGLAWLQTPVAPRDLNPSSVISSGLTAYTNALGPATSFGGVSINSNWLNYNTACINWTATSLSTTTPMFLAFSTTTAYIGFSWEL